MEPAEISDEDLLAQCQDGSIRSFETLLLRYQPRVLRFHENQLGNLEDAKDVTQQTFLQVHDKLSRFKLGKPFSPWLFTIARRQGIDFLRQIGSRKRAIDKLSSEDKATPPTDPQQSLSQREEVDRIWQWIQSNLDERSAQILWLRIQEEFDLSAIAKVMNLSQGNVKVLIHRARKLLLETFPIKGAPKRISNLVKIAPQPTTK